MITLNFYVAALVLAGFGVLSLSDSYSLFNFNADLYGALDNNLRMMMVYLALIEVVMIFYCWMVQKFQAMALVGFFLIVMIETVQFYGEINAVAIDENLPPFFLYTGLSHLLFGMMCIIGADRSQPQQPADKQP
ncbi:MAG: hypothetical protein PHU14_02280 [Methylovulum sp.]|nr:hypothetical protein [Methylovulum sp.]